MAGYSIHNTSTGTVLSNRARGERKRKKKETPTQCDISFPSFLFFFLSFSLTSLPARPARPVVASVDWQAQSFTVIHELSLPIGGFLLDLLHYYFLSPQGTTDPSDYPCPSAYRHRSCTTLRPLSVHQWEKRTNQHTHDVCAWASRLPAATRVAFGGAELPEAY